MIKIFIWVIANSTGIDQEIPACTKFKQGIRSAGMTLWTLGL
jgi:hypothetical protein